MIHSSAIVGAGAQIGANVEIGPHTILGDEVTVGDDTIIGANVVIEGEVQIGRGNRIGHGVLIGGEPQDVSFSAETRSRVEIGDRNLIREYCTIHRGTKDGSATTIGNENFLMTGAHIGHNCTVGNNVVIANNVLLAGYVSLANNAFIGGGTTLHQFTRVGRLVMVQGSSGFGKDLPPFTLAAERNAIFGLNVVGLRRGGFTAVQREEIKRAFKLLYLSGLNTKQALEKSRELKWTELGREFFEFVEEALKGRGVCPYHRSTE
ncbi:MAG: acyl-ACP--UDP-N-acetylglucosamine O-acyltransferase [Chthoniobacterales bacterium]|nr:MAG: acyl-ACP--UDP-N-acetylglucosamine O-acyltransferase [Chthoniobacterales bacterium]